MVSSARCRIASLCPKGPPMQKLSWLLFLSPACKVHAIRLACAANEGPERVHVHKMPQKGDVDGQDVLHGICKGWTVYLCNKLGHLMRRYLSSSLVQHNRSVLPANA